MAPGVFDGPAQLLRIGVATGLEHARQQRLEKRAKRVSGGLTWQQRLERVDALAPARAQQLTADEGLQRLRGIEQAQAVGWQHQQWQLARTLMGHRLDKAAQHGHAAPLRCAQTVAGERALAARQRFGFEPARDRHRVGTAVGGLGQVRTLAHHREVAGRVAGVVANPVDAGRQSALAALTQRLTQDRAHRHLDLLEVAGRDLQQLHIQTAQPGMHAQLQPLANGGPWRDGVVAEARHTGMPAELQRRGLERVRSRRCDAKARVVEPELEADALKPARRRAACAVGGRQPPAPRGAGNEPVLAVVGKEVGCHAGFLEMAAVRRGEASVRAWWLTE